MDFRSLPFPPRFPLRFPSACRPRARAAAGGLALALLAAAVAQAEPLKEIGSSFDEAGRALNRQIGDWVGTPQTPRAPAKRRSLPANARTTAGKPATAPLPPSRPADISASAEAPLPTADPQDITSGGLPPAQGEAARTDRPATAARGVVPLPPLRPAEATAQERVAAIAPPAPAPVQPAAPAPQAMATICPELSNDDLGTFEPYVVAATDPLCTVDRGVSLSAVRMKDGRLVELSPPAALRCEMAASVAHWLREKVDPAVASLGSPLDKVMVAASQQCRPRNRVTGARISEHGRGNALDTRGYVLTDGRRVVIGKPGGSGEQAMPLAFQDELKRSACADFTTILGPGSDGYHEQHLHVDRAQRRSGAVLCRWSTANVEAMVPTPPARPTGIPAQAPAAGPSAAPDEGEAPERGPATTAP